MEVRALCIGLMTLVLVLLGSHIHSCDAAFRIVPSRLQLFQYEPLTFHCEGLDGSGRLRGIRSTEGFLSVCDAAETPVASCRIHKAYRADSGQYWCETEGEDRSNSVRITITNGSVILESPVLPVMEGDCVSLRCRNQTTSSDLMADFYKDGLLIGSSSAGEMILHSVSASDKGFYKCSISDVGESPQSWLAVGDLLRELHPSSDDSMQVWFVLRTVFTVLLLSLMLLLVGLLHFRKLEEHFS